VNIPVLIRLMLEEEVRMALEVQRQNDTLLNLLPASSAASPASNRGVNNPSSRLVGT
jgi:hypothetical protein